MSGSAGVREAVGEAPSTRRGRNGGTMQISLHWGRQAVLGTGGGSWWICCCNGVVLSDSNMGRGRGTWGLHSRKLTWTWDPVRLVFLYKLVVFRVRVGTCLSPTRFEDVGGLQFD